MPREMYDDGLAARVTAGSDYYGNDWIVEEPDAEETLQSNVGLNIGPYFRFSVNITTCPGIAGKSTAEDRYGTSRMVEPATAMSGLCKTEEVKHGPPTATPSTPARARPARALRRCARRLSGPARR